MKRGDPGCSSGDIIISSISEAAAMDIMGENGASGLTGKNDERLASALCKELIHHNKIIVTNVFTCKDFWSSYGRFYIHLRRFGSD